MDSWYMRQYFISTMLNRGFHVIGQVRRDTRLYNLPAPRLERQRGRSRQYGEKLTPEQAE
ncbi:transposase [Nitrosomonas sp. Nm34]|uniref:transposase n=1 Tax=Nitrosomonas sp. Nm34 TaxID=1881055 RepID=UPI001113A84A|nr:transposase [Nitrosomonas sp. Nm34]